MIPLVVYDTMLFFQAAAQVEPRLHATFRAVNDHKVVLCMSPELYEEIADILTRTEMQEKAPSLTDERVKQFLAKIKTLSRWFVGVPAHFTIPEHSDDDHLFNLAIVAKADFLVTWENRLLKFNQNNSSIASKLRSLAPQLKILTPTDFVAQLKRQSKLVA